MKDDDELDIGAETDNDFTGYKNKAFSKLSREVSEADLSNPTISRI